MYNTLKLPQISKIVQVGIRDFCEEEVELVNKENGGVLVHTDTDLKKQLFEGNTVRRLKKKLLDPNRKTRYKILVMQFGVSEMQLHRIKTGENWGHIIV
jgi:hypothetical protein